MANACCRKGAGRKGRHREKPMEREAQPGRAAPHRGNGLRLAIEKAGGIVALARGLGISQPSVSAWRRIPADRVLAVEALTGVSRDALRPDLHTGAKSSAHPPIEGVDVFSSVADELDQARARQYLLLATLLSKAPSQTLLDELAGLRGRRDTARAVPRGAGQGCGRHAIKSARASSFSISSSASAAATCCPTPRSTGRGS